MPNIDISNRIQYLKERLAQLDSQKATLDIERNRNFQRQHYDCDHNLCQLCECECSPQCQIACQRAKYVSLGFFIGRCKYLINKRRDILNQLYILENIDQIVEQSSVDMPKNNN